MLVCKLFKFRLIVLILFQINYLSISVPANVIYSPFHGGMLNAANSFSF